MLQLEHDFQSIISNESVTLNRIWSKEFREKLPFNAITDFDWGYISISSAEEKLIWEASALVNIRCGFSIDLYFEDYKIVRHHIDS